MVRPDAADILHPNRDPCLTLDTPRTRCQMLHFSFNQNDLAQ